MTDDLDALHLLQERIRTATQFGGEAHFDRDATVALSEFLILVDVALARLRAAETENGRLQNFLNALADDTEPRFPKIADAIRAALAEGETP